MTEVSLPRTPNSDMLALTKSAVKPRGHHSACAQRARALLAVFGIPAMLVFTPYSLHVQKNVDGLIKLPVIDKHHIRPLALER